MVCFFVLLRLYIYIVVFDRVKVVINAAEVKLTGRKFEDKKYTWHTGYVGGLKQRTVREQMNIKPEEVKKKKM